MPLVGGVVSFAGFLVYERRAKEPMLELELFTRRNFAVGNVETLALYAGLAILFFFLVIFLQQVAGYSALESGLTTLPVTIVMFALSRRFGALADRFGPRCSWAPARWSPRPGSCCSCASAWTRRTSPTYCRRCSSSRSALR